jgi:hypothetical protein
LALKKKLIALLLALVTVFLSLTCAFSSLGATYLNMQLDTIYINSISGSGDMIWFSYTPQISGTYSFVSYAVGKSQAYLYTMTTDENGIRSYNGLAYAPASDPNYMDEDVRTFVFADQTYTHTATGFRLTYHLDAGTTYYYSAGWATTYSQGEMRVRLKCDEYDSTQLDSVTATCSAHLKWYTDGEWRTDSQGNSYYYYNYTKILQNMTVTLKYTDGTTSSVSGGTNKIDDYSISYNCDQSKTHWYVESDDNYTANIITVTVGNVSYDYNVIIDQGALYSVTGYVVDYVTGEPVANAKLLFNSSTVATTESNGRFNFAYAAGSYNLTVTADNAIPRSINVVIDANNTSNNYHDSNPISLVVGDYVADGIINAKDYGYIVHSLSGDTQVSEKSKFASQVGFTINDYEEW